MAIEEPEGKSKNYIQYLQIKERSKNKNTKE